jgi:hypothetical protein
MWSTHYFCRILKPSLQIFEKDSNTKFHQNPSSGSRVISCGQTDMQLILAFRNFANARKNEWRRVGYVDCHMPHQAVSGRSPFEQLASVGRAIIPHMFTEVWNWASGKGKSRWKNNYKWSSRKSMTKNDCITALSLLLNTTYFSSRWLQNSV